MARRSSLEDLPQELLDEVNSLVGERGWTIDQVVEYLREAGYPRSRSAVGRHSKRVRELGERLRQSREITEALVKEMGPAAQEGQQGRLLAQMLRTLVHDHLEQQLQEGGSTPDPEQFAYLARTLKEISQATRHDQDFEQKIREQVRQEEREQAAQQAVEAAKSAGLSGEKAADIRRDILGAPAA